MQLQRRVEGQGAGKHDDFVSGLFRAIPVEGVDEWRNAREVPICRCMADGYRSGWPAG
jgi:hypothetical protein